MVQKQAPVVGPTPGAPQLQPLIQSCLHLDPDARPKPQAVVEVGVPALGAGLLLVGATLAAACLVWWNKTGSMHEG